VKATFVGNLLLAPLGPLAKKFHKHLLMTRKVRLRPHSARIWPADLWWWSEILLIRHLQTREVLQQL